MANPTALMEASYPLTPLQHGMLFHSLSAPESGVNIEQMICGLPGPIDPAALQSAWQRVAERHGILRTAFRWQDCDEPRQDVFTQIDIPWDQQDWRSASVEQQQVQREELLAADRRRGFSPDQPPLMRLTLVRLADAKYELIWTFHHALLDGRSFPIVLHEAFEIYAGLRDGREVELPPPKPFREFVEWLRRRDDGPAEAFWRKMLRGFTAPTPLVVDRLVRTRAPGAGALAGETETRLTATFTSALESFARKHDLTLNTLVQGAWAILLSRYSGEGDVVFGVTRACRRSAMPGAEAMVGLLINTLPLRIKAARDAELVPWLQELRAAWAALRDFEHTPLVRIQNWSEVPAGRPLFESLVVFEKYQLEAALRAHGAAWRERTFRLREQNNFPLTLAAYGGAELHLKLQFDPSRFDGATMQRMLGHLCTLLESMPAEPRRPLGELPLLTAEERRDLTARTPRARPRTPGLTLARWFESQAALTPDRIAVTCEDTSLTYHELNTRANRLAHHLRRCGVGPEVMVGLFLDRSLDLVTGILAILKAGGAYVPMDPVYPPDRLGFIIADARLPVVVTERTLSSRLPPHAARVICVDDPCEAASIAQQPPGNPESTANADNLAYVIYTSGSTGTPKGVLVTQHNVVRLFQTTEPLYQFNQDDVWTLFHSCAFDFSVWELWGALLYGGRLVVVPYATSRSPDAFLSLLARERVTVLNQTPSAFRQLIHAHGQAGLSRESLALRYVVFGGEALELKSLEPWFGRCGDERPRLVNMYGITETTVHVTHRPLTRADTDSGSVIGGPLADLQLYVLDVSGQPVPIGVPGELYVAGGGLARGYLNRPDLTAERFVPNPFDPGERCYRTGDLARWLPGGDVEYLGRIDHQVKIRGFRIEPGEIESVLCRHPLVREAVVLARAGESASRHLVAYIVAPDQPPSAAELRDHLAAKLPEYMIPAAFVALDRLPLTDHGKVDRMALPAPKPERPQLRSSYIAPRTATEQMLEGIWRRVLRLDRVGVDDNFFEAGGDSLRIVSLLGLIRGAGHADLQITDLFQHPTIAALAAHLDRRPGASRQRVVERARRQANAVARRAAELAPTES